MSTVTDFDLQNDSVIFKDFVGGRFATTADTSDGLRIEHASGTSNVILQGVTQAQFDDSGGLAHFVHYSNDYQMSWDGSVEGNQTLTDFDLDFDKITSASGASFAHLLVKGVYNADGQPQTKLTFAHDGEGWEGQGYLINAEVDAVTAKLGSILVGAWGTPEEAIVHSTYGVNITSHDLYIPNGISFFKKFDGSDRNESFTGIGAGTDVHLNGGGGQDTWHLQTSDLSWYGMKRVFITDFDHNAGDKLDLSGIVDDGGLLQFKDTGIDGNLHVNVYRAGHKPDVPLDLTFTQLTIHNPNGPQGNWDDLIASGAVLLA